MSQYLAHFEDEASADAIYLACGKLAINWGQVEGILDSILVRLRNRQKHPHTNYKYTDFPVSFSKKRDEIKDRFKKDAPLHDLREPVTAFMSEAKGLHDIRVIVVHGICQGTRLSGKIEFTMSDQRGVGGWGSKWLTLAQIQGAADRMLSLHREAEGLIGRVPLR